MQQQQQNQYQPQYQPQYQQSVAGQYQGQPVAAYPAPAPQVIIQQVVVEQPQAPGLLDLRSAQEVNQDNANYVQNPDGKEDIGEKL